MQQEELGRTRGAYKAKEIMTMKKKKKGRVWGDWGKANKVRIHPPPPWNTLQSRISPFVVCVLLCEAEGTWSVFAIKANRRLYKCGPRKGSRHAQRNLKAQTKIRGHENGLGWWEDYESVWLIFLPSFLWNGSGINVRGNKRKACLSVGRECENKWCTPTLFFLSLSLAKVAFKSGVK